MTSIVDLAPEHEAAYLACLEEWSPDMREAGDRKKRWLERMRDQGLRVKLALDDARKPVGMIQTVPIEHAPVIGRDAIFVLCVWVHGHRAGVGNHQGRGIGSMLLEAAERDARGRGAKAVVAWGLRLPAFMRAAWFRKHGYDRADVDGVRVLLVKRFAPDVPLPRWLPAGPNPPDVPGKVIVTMCGSGWCPAGNITFARASSVAEELGAEVREVDTCCNRAALEAWGTDQALFVDDRAVLMGPPVPRDRLRRIVARRVRRKKKK